MVGSIRIGHMVSTLHSQELEDIRHHQIADKAFQDKCRLPMARFLEEQGKQVQAQDRVYNLVPKSSVQEPCDTESSAQATSTLPGCTQSDVAIERGGVWKDGQGRYYLLECTHFMSAVFIPNMLQLIES